MKEAGAGAVETFAISASTLVLAIYVMVTLVDALSGWLRRRVI